MWFPKGLPQTGPGMTNRCSNDRIKQITYVQVKSTDITFTSNIHESSLIGKSLSVGNSTVYSTIRKGAITTTRTTTTTTTTTTTAASEIVLSIERSGEGKKT
ncbi:hypothetical protein HZH68_006884 [Vespula germanica]|uniref:Uncharacterized protein n=1 Tax=Vespula germanica TaxID=30212 RepID=A0A834K5Y7_VESGE|nr:hypothetical protein HZH68_006884 [Vespula germanica]